VIGPSGVLTAPNPRPCQTEGSVPNLRLRVVGTAEHGFLALPAATSYSHVVRIERQ
jgi:hypothetical protein